MAGIFIIGVDTGVGKTVVCSGLLKLLHGTRSFCYWKPVQTGTIVGNDTEEVKALSGLSDDSFMEPAYRFPEPVSPHLAARKWGKNIDIQIMRKQLTLKEDEGFFVVIEGAGGLLVPFNEIELQIDFIKSTKFPVLIIAQDRVGAINQTLLTLSAARTAGIPIAGVVLTKSQGQFGNSEAISSFGKVEVLAEIPPSNDKRSLIAQIGADDGLRKFFNVAKLPA